MSLFSSGSTIARNFHGSFISSFASWFTNVSATEHMALLQDSARCASRRLSSSRLSSARVAPFASSSSMIVLGVVHAFLTSPSSVYSLLQTSSAHRRSLLCRRIISYTSYSRTNDCIYNGYVHNNLEHNTMINIDTVAHMNMHYTQCTEHTERSSLMHIVSHRGSSCLARVIPSMHVHLCVVWWLFSSTRLLFLFVPSLFFQTFQMSSSEFHEKFKSKDLRDFRLGDRG